MMRTGVFATAEEIEHFKHALDAPYLIAGGMEPEPVSKQVHRYALAHGLPEILGYYGIDLRDGEFVRDD